MAADSASEERATRRVNRIGPTGLTIAKNIARLRAARGLSTAALAAVMETRGITITASAITKTELAQRKVEAEELFVFAIALGVNPSALYGPAEWSSFFDEVEATGIGTVDPTALWDWLDGVRPFDLPDGDDGSAWNEFQLRARPEGRRNFRAS